MTSLDSPDKRTLAVVTASWTFSQVGRCSQSVTYRQLAEEDGVNYLCTTATATADFNEDFSAFHAATLREQAEYLSDALRYILTLYRDDDAGAPHPTSVIVVAHSMGGIAARLMLLQPDLPPGSVRTLVTLSTPHQIPPATFDREIERVYNDINRHWKESYASAPSEHPLKDLLLVSIAGGTADTTVSSDYTGISSFTPPSNGFTIFATSVPSLFSPVDHLAMVWCDQLRYSIVRGLLETTDAKAADRARPLPERLDIMQRALVAGLSTAERRATNGEGPVNLPIDTAQDVEGESMSWFSERGSTTEALFAFTPDPAQARVLEILTDISTASISVYSCIKSEVDFSCTSAKGRTVRQLPKSTSDSDPNTVRPLNEDYSSLIRVHEITAGRQLVIKVSDAKPGAFLAAAAKASFETTQMDTSVLGQYRQQMGGTMDSVAVSVLKLRLLPFDVGTVQPLHFLERRCTPERTRFQRLSTSLDFGHLCWSIASAPAIAHVRSATASHVSISIMLI